MIISILNYRLFKLVDEKYFPAACNKKIKLIFIIYNEMNVLLLMSFLLHTYFKRRFRTNIRFVNLLKLISYRDKTFPQNKKKPF